MHLQELVNPGPRPSVPRHARPSPHAPGDALERPATRLSGMATLVLIRHGESVWNSQGLFTGWVDVGLSPKGVDEAVNSGRQLEEAGLRPDIVHTSVLTRAIQTAHLALESADLLWLPVRRSWRL